MGIISYVFILFVIVLECLFDLVVYNMVNVLIVGYKVQYFFLEVVDLLNLGDEIQVVSFVKDNGIYVDLMQGVLV